jgi:hypothetical protein
MRRRKSMVLLPVLLGLGMAWGTHGLTDRVLAAPLAVVVAGETALGGSPGGSFGSQALPVEACQEYTLRLNYNMVPGGTPGENLIGFQVWNNKGNVNLTDQPFGQRKWEGSAQRYYLESLRRPDVPSIEEITFKVDCADANPSYTVRTFNYGPGSTLNHSFALVDAEVIAEQAERQVAASDPVNGAIVPVRATKGGPVTSLPGGQEN